MINDLKATLMGVDTTKEIFDLWYELLYIRTLLSILLEKNPSLAESLPKHCFEDARKIAQEHLKKKFPDVSLEYKENH